MEGVYRIRVGDYRVLYEVRRKEGIILVIKIEHRKHAFGILKVHRVVDFGWKSRTLPVEMVFA